jgi:hypothetical protein
MKFLVPADGSETALDAVRHVLHLWREGLEVTLVLATVAWSLVIPVVVLPGDKQPAADSARWSTFLFSWPCCSCSAATPHRRSPQPRLRLGFETALGLAPS